MRRLLKPITENIVKEFGFLPEILGFFYQRY